MVIFITIEFLLALEYLSFTLNDKNLKHNSLFHRLVITYNMLDKRPHPKKQRCLKLIMFSISVEFIVTVSGLYFHTQSGS